MNFCWFTSFIGYPNFFESTGHAHELAQVFLKLAEASTAGKTYSESKSLFPSLDHAQVETKKAAFQEYGLLYVVPRSDTITLTPLGAEIVTLAPRPNEAKRNRDSILLSLCSALSRYQFDNPSPVGGRRYSARSGSSDVLPYLVLYYLLQRLTFLTTSELMGSVFGLQNMNDLITLEHEIEERRASGVAFPPLSALPANQGTAQNLKIYLMSHSSLDGELTRSSQVSVYGFSEQAFELTEYGAETTAVAISSQWPQWEEPASTIPVAKTYGSMQDYFQTGIGRALLPSFVKKAALKQAHKDKQRLVGVLDIDDLASLKSLPKREFEEGRRRLVKHARLEKVRNPALVLEAKRLFKASHGILKCEVCDFDFEAAYGDRGKDYIEAHHTTPISEIEDITHFTVDDVRMVCSNCHRMLHRAPWIAVEQLRASMQSAEHRDPLG